MKETELRVVYKELTKDDYDKIEADSPKEPKSGGGARDIRFNKDAFDDIVGKMLPRREKVDRVGGNVAYVGTVKYEPSEERELVWEPATRRRKSEKRFARIHKSPPFRAAPRVEDMVVLMIIQVEDESLRVHYAREEDLESGLWRPEIADPILGCIQDKRERDSRNAVRGYIDFTKTPTDTYCHI
jgi:hypothetical protein